MDSNKTITTVLFDAGGTLIHLDHGFLQRTLRKAGFTVTRRAVREAECASKIAIDQRLQALVTDTDETRRQPYFVALLDRLGVDKEKASYLLHEFETAHKRENLWRIMLPSTPHVLASLRKHGVTLGVVSNSDGRIRAILEGCGIARFFDVIVDSHEVGVEKPDPRIFQLALSQMQARSEQTLYVGDIYNIDVVGAGRAGLRPVLIDRCGCYASVSGKTIKQLRALLTMVR
jgi:putative hydrolase of the HAD superfamily